MPSTPQILKTVLSLRFIWSVQALSFLGRLNAGSKHHGMMAREQPRRLAQTIVFILMRIPNDPKPPCVCVCFIGGSERLSSRTIDEA